MRGIGTMQGGEGHGGGPQGPDWSLNRDGLEQLGQLNTMERGQDSTTWSTNALHSATNGVLVVAAISALSHDNWAAIIISISILGAFISTSWSLVLLRAHQYEVEWLHRARWLQRELKIPGECTIWQDYDSKFRPQDRGISSHTVLRVLVSGFYFGWVVTMIVAVQFGVLDCDKRLIASLIAAVVSLSVFAYFFLLQISRADEFEDALQGLLGLPMRPKKK